MQVTSSPPAPPLTPTSAFVDLLDYWLLLIGHDGKRTKKTVARYRRQRHYLEALFDRRMDELDRPSVLQWHDELSIRKGPCFADTAAMVLRTILEFAWNRGLVGMNNASRMGLGYQADAQPPLTSEQWARLVGQLLDLTAERHERAIRQRRSPAHEFASTSAASSCLALLFSGPRQDDITRSKCDWWRLDRQSLRVPNGKTGWQEIAFGSRLGVPFMQNRCVEARALGFEFLFPSPHRDSHITNGALWDTWTIACGRAGIRGIPPHGARRTAACDLIEADVGEERVMEFLNHRRIKTTQLYTAMASRPGRRRTAEALDDVRAQHPELLNRIDRIRNASAFRAPVGRVVQTGWNGGGAQ